MSFYSIGPLITSLLLLFLGVVVFFKNKHSMLNKIFFLICISGFAWLFLYSIGYGYKDETSAFLLFKIGYSGVVFIPITTFHYTIEFLRIKKLKSFALLNYLIGLICIALIWSSFTLIKGISLFFWGYYPQSGPFHPFFLIYFFGLVSFSFALWFYFFLFRKKLFTLLEILRIKYVLLAFAVYNFASVDFLPNYGIAIYPFGFLPSFIFAAIIGYTIVRFRLLDIHIVFKKTAVYSLSAGLLASFFVVFVLAMTKYLANFAHITSFSITAIAALIIAFLFNPLKNRIQTVIDKKFYKKTYDYYSTVQEVTHELASSFSLGRIYSFIGGIIASALSLKNIYLLSLMPGEKYVTIMVYSASHEEDSRPRSKETINIDKSPAVITNSIENSMKESEMVIDGNSETVKLLKAHDVIIREELPQIHKIKQEVIDKVNTDLKPFKGEAVAPVFVDNNLELLMVLSEKISGDIFTNEDIKLLKTVSYQMAIAIKNAKLYVSTLTSERLASIGMMSATFAHEIKNPLTSIKTFAQLLPERYSDIDFRENFSKIVVDSANRIDGLIKDLLDFSSGRTPAEMSTLNIVKFMDRLIDDTMKNLKLNNKNITIVKDYGDINIDVLGDEKKLYQAFSNVIMNGCQSIPVDRNDGSLRVGIIQNKDNVDISIADNGDGMCLEDVTRIFEPFFSTKTVGAGLGLAITKKIIEDHCGKIVVDSTIRKGTTFKITLPLKKAEEESGNFSST